MGKKTVSNDKSELYIAKHGDESKLKTNQNASVGWNARPTGSVYKDITFG